ncbi:uncharacterized protein F4817DRAFT_368391 [Daldinia loculata]|uniref:uncharacterized protein n=1 Tax=Daldinia loculata TaxID=103429 RepID=UPI0020C1EC95|nr:uncharacterized protein F4817DRAFT_368391 [Daldinia loculata]KAI1643480.1 hypothetical protein F4817DRAFT_368391 [Daldinia loculata]
MDQNNINCLHPTPAEVMDPENSFKRYLNSRRVVQDVLRPILIRHLLDMDNIENTIVTTSRSPLQDHIKNRIYDWATSSHQDAIWIQGPHGAPYPSQNTLTAIFIKALSKDLEIPCVSYFCSLRLHGVPLGQDGLSTLSCQELLLEMVKSIVAQLANFLPRLIFRGVDPSIARIVSLINPEADISVALEILREIRNAAPLRLHCIIEGVQLLEDRSNLRHTQNLRRTLHELSNISTPMPWLLEDEAWATKTCFTSGGYVDALAQMVEDGHVDKVEVEE